MHRKLLPALAAFVLMTGASLPAIAAEPTEAPTAKVRVADLDLDTDAGARVALARIQRAAGKVCGGEPDARLLERQGRYDVCVRDAVDRTVASAHSPRLTALNGAAQAKETQLASAR